MKCHFTLVYVNHRLQKVSWTVNSSRLRDLLLRRAQRKQFYVIESGRVWVSK